MAWPSAIRITQLKRYKIACDEIHRRLIHLHNKKEALFLAPVKEGHVAQAGLVRQKASPPVDAPDETGLLYTGTVLHGSPYIRLFACGKSSLVISA